METVGTLLPDWSARRTFAAPACRCARNTKRGGDVGACVRVCVGVCWVGAGDHDAPLLMVPLVLHDTPHVSNPPCSPRNGKGGLSQPPPHALPPPHASTRAHVHLPSPPMPLHVRREGGRVGLGGRRHCSRDQLGAHVRHFRRPARYGTQDDEMVKSMHQSV